MLGDWLETNKVSETVIVRPLRIYRSRLVNAHPSRGRSANIWSLAMPII